MTTTQPLSPGQTARKDEIIFPTGEFWSDEPPLESNLHLTQIILLIKCLEWLWQDREDYFATGNLTIYYRPNQKKSEYFRRPDFFVVLGTTRNPNRKSWVVWQEEGKYPGSSRLCVIIFAYGVVKCLSGKTFRAILRKKVSV